jgi:hypothetical protein
MLATQVAEIRSIAIRSQPQANSMEGPMLKISYTKKAGGVIHVVECLPSKSEALSSNPSTVKTNGVPFYILIKYIIHIFFIHLSACEHLGCFHVPAIVNNGEVNMTIQISPQDLDSIPFRYRYRSKTSGSFSRPLLNFLVVQQCYI